MKGFASMPPWHSCVITDRRTMQDQASAQVWISPRTLIMQNMIAGSQEISFQILYVWVSRLEVEVQAWSTQSHLFLSTRLRTPIKTRQAFRNPVDLRLSWLQTSPQVALMIHKCKALACRWVLERCPLASQLPLKVKESAKARVAQHLKDVR